MQVKWLVGVVICFAVLTSVFFSLSSVEVGWDTSVYLGSARFVVGYGGLWEPLRPVLWPVLLSFGAFSDGLVFGKVLSLFFLIASLILTFLIGREVFGEKSGLFALLVLSFSSAFVFYPHMVLTELPAVTLVLASVLLFLRGYFFASGFFAALAFLTKFPMGIVILSLLLFSLSKFRAFSSVFVGFSIPVVAYLIFNTLMYNNPFLPFEQASYVISTAGIWLYREGFLFYPLEIIKDNPLFVFAPLGLIAGFVRGRKALFLFSVLFFIFGYFEYLAHKEVRFIVLFLPLVALFVGEGLSVVRLKRSHAVVFFVLLMLPFWWHNVKYYSVYESPRDFALEEFFARHSEVKYVFNPYVARYSNASLSLLYYPVFTEELEAQFERLNGSVLFSDCDFVCEPSNSSCSNLYARFESFVESNFRLVGVYKGRCSFKVYESS